MKKSELRKIIREEITNLNEQGPLGGYFCMNDYDAAGPGYCVSQFPQNGTGGQAVYEAMQDDGMGVWQIHATLDECIASPQCSEEYTHGVYPPPSGGPNPNNTGWIGKPGTEPWNQNYAANPNKAKKIMKPAGKKRRGPRGRNMQRHLNQRN